ncbi:MAG TPA: HK97 gp10 family phage protein [Alphaproteobacteria bacterium]|nr:HK97 gp10 family phage protein [Alphaproteobacteria bacterium]
MPITLRGLPETLQALAALNGDVQAVLPGALFQVGEQIMTEAKALTPVDTGALRASGTVLPPEQDGTTVRVVLGFGGPAIPYALRQHEDVTLRHTVGQAKFLEQPFNAIAGQLDTHLAAAVRRIVQARSRR